MDAGTFVDTNWALISGHPGAFVTVAIVCLGLGFGFAKLLQGERVSSLEGRLKFRDDEIADYQRKLGGASPDEAKARLDALEAQVRALAPRRLSADQRDTIRAVIATDPGGVRIGFDVAVGDARALAGDFAAVFQQAGWRAGLAMMAGIGNPPPSGIAVSMPDITAPTARVQAVMDALRSAGIEFDRQRLGQHPEGAAPDCELLITAAVQP